MRRALLLGFAALLAGYHVYAQVGVSTSGSELRVGADGSVSIRGRPGQDLETGPGGQVTLGSGNRAHSSTGEVSPDANIEGVTIINGKLWIDGKEIPPRVKRYQSPKTGKTYRIERNGNNVSVSSGD